MLDDLFTSKIVVWQVLQSRNIQLHLGYYVNCIKAASMSEKASVATSNGEALNFDNETTHSKFTLELQPAERGLESKIVKADLVLWTVGSKPLIPQLVPFDQPRVIQLNVRGQAETDETLRVKGHPRIFAIGDSAALRDSSGRLLPATAQVCPFMVSFIYVFLISGVIIIKHSYHPLQSFSGCFSAGRFCWLEPLGGNQ